MSAADILRGGRPDLDPVIERGVLKVVVEGEGVGLAGAHLAGTTTLNVSAGAFRTAGQCQVDGVTYDYTRTDDVLTINPPLAADQEDGEPVVSLAPSGLPETSRVAVIDLDMDGDPEGDIRATISGDLVGYYPLGDAAAGALVGVRDTSYGYEVSGRPADAPLFDGSVIDPDTLPATGFIQWEKNDRYYEALLAGGTVTQVLKHKGIAIDHEFLAFINGVALAPENYTLDAVNGIVTVTIPTWVGTDSDLWFHYAYRDDSPLAAVPFTYVGKTTTHAVDASSLAWPAGTQVGDLAIVGVIGRSSGNQAVTDKRFTVRENLVFSADRIVVATAVVTDLATPVAVSVDDLGAVQEANSMLFVIRPTEPIRFVVPPTDSGTQAPGAGSVPAVNGVSGAVGVFFTIGGIGGAYGWSWPAGWTSPQVIGTYSTVNFAVAVGPNVSAWTPISGGFGDNWRGFSIGLGLG